MANTFNGKARLIVTIVTILILQTGAITWTISWRLSRVTTKIENIESTLADMKSNSEQLKVQEVKLEEVEKDVMEIKHKVETLERRDGRK